MSKKYPKLKIINHIKEMGTSASINTVIPQWGSISGTLSDQTDLQAALDLKANSADLSDVALSGNHSDLNLDDGTNPHGTTKSDVGLGNCDNTSDLDKPISTATEAALDGKLDYEDEYIVDLAGQSNATYSYTGSKLTGIAFADTAEITSNSKTLSYTGDLLTGISHVFTFNSQVWTVTSTLSYTGSQLTGKTTTINKV